MRKVVLLSLTVFFGLWIALGAYLGGLWVPEWLPASVAALKRPVSTADLGQSFAVLDGILSSMAVVLGLAAVLIQGRELQASTRAQNDQARSLTLQIEQQHYSNRLGAFSARLQFLIAENDRLDQQIQKLVADVEKEIDTGKKNEMWGIIKNSRSLQIERRSQAREIDSSLQKMLSVSQPK